MTITLSILGIAIGTIGVVTGVVLYYLGRKEKAPVCTYENTLLIDRAALTTEKIRIATALGESLDRVTATRLVLWNKGRDTISRDDLRHPSGFLEVIFSDDVEVLDVEVERPTREMIAFSAYACTEPRNKVRITFDHLERNDGAIIRVWHTGKGDERVSISGAVRGNRAGVANMGDYRKLRTSEFPATCTIFSGLGAGVLLVGLYVLIAGDSSANPSILELGLALTGTGAVAVGVISWLLLRWRKKFPSPPEDLSL